MVNFLRTYFLNLSPEFLFYPLSANIDFSTKLKLVHEPKLNSGILSFCFSVHGFVRELRVGEAGSFALLWFECRMCGNANVPDCANETVNCRAGITHNLLIVLITF